MRKREKKNNDFLQQFNSQMCVLVNAFIFFLPIKTLLNKHQLKQHYLLFIITLKSIFTLHLTAVYFFFFINR